MPKIKINNHNLNYNITGEGEPLIMINGLGLDSLSWGAIPAELSKQFKVIVLDNYGAGQSDHPDGDMLVADMASDVISLLDELKIDKANVFGQSMGGTIAQTLTANYPERVIKLILCNTFAEFNFASCLSIKSLIEMRQQKVNVDTVINNILAWSQSSEFLQRGNTYEEFVKIIKSNPYPQPLDSFIAQSKALFQFNSSDWLDKITCPTLVIAAAGDLWVLPSEADFLQTHIKNSELKVVPGGHGSQFEQPALLVDMIGEFLD